MTTLAADPAETNNDFRGWARWSGIAFLVLFVSLYVFMVSGPGVFEGSTLEEYAAAYDDTSRVDQMSLVVIGLVPLTGAALLLTGSYLRGQLERATGRATVATRITTLGAAVTAIGFTVAAAAAAAAAHVATGSSDGGFPPDPAVGYSFDLFAALLLTVTAWGLSMLVLGVGVTTRRTGQLPGWMSWVAIVIGAVLPISWVLGSIPLLIVMLWLPAACLMIKNGRRAA